MPPITAATMKPRKPQMARKITYLMAMAKLLPQDTRSVHPSSLRGDIKI